MLQQLLEGVGAAIDHAKTAIDKLTDEINASLPSIKQR